MVKLNNKSKRVSCSKRYKIEKRIRDHNKKARKETTKMGEKKTKKKMKKTFNVPNKFPFKEEILNIAVQKREAEVEAKKQKKDEKNKLKAQIKLKEKSDFKTSATSLDDLVKQAEKKQDKFELLPAASLSSAADESLEGKETSLKTFYKEFRKVVDASDVIIEVLDARDPMGSRCPQVEQTIVASGSNKKLILLLNKIDLVPKQNVQEWLKYLRSQYPTVAFKSSTQNQNDRLSQSSVPVDLASASLLTSAKCLGADILVKLLNNYTRINDLKQTITVGIIGLPNVGKSSVINSLKRSSACLIGSTPGLTRCMKEIKLDKHVKLLDCPGIVMSKEENMASLVLKNCIKIENIEDPIAPIDLLLSRCNKEQLVLRYKIAPFNDANEFLTLVAKRCGKIKKNGIADINKAAHLILNDWTSGKITYYTKPPELPKPTETKLVAEFGKAFDIDELIKEEEQQLFNSIKDTQIVVDGIETEATSPIKVNFDELADTSAMSEDEKKNEEEKKPVEFKSDVVLNAKVNKKNKKASDTAADDDEMSGSQKRKLSRAGLEYEDEEEIYKSENIPRTKKAQKLEKKKQQKNEKRSDKLFNNLGDMLNSVKLSTATAGAKKEKKKTAVNNAEPYDFKTDFKL